MGFYWQGNQTTTFNDEWNHVPSWNSADYRRRIKEKWQGKSSTWKRTGRNHTSDRLDLRETEDDGYQVIRYYNKDEVDDVYGNGELTAMRENKKRGPFKHNLHSDRRMNKYIMGLLAFFFLMVYILH